MKNIFAVLVGIALAMLSHLVLAAPVVVNALTGTAQAIPGAGAPRSLRNGDEVDQGDTVATGENSSLILRFDDGQVVALASRSRMVVNAYAYNRAEPAKSNILLSLLNGSMRAITGLVGRNNPASVSYRVRNVTVGIRGTDVTLATADGDVAVTVADGSIGFTFNGQTVLIPAGEGARTLPDGTVQSAPAAQIIAAVAAQNPALGALLQAVNSATLQNAVRDALRQSQQPSSPPTSPLGTPRPSGSTTGTGGTGGGSPSKS